MRPFLEPAVLSLPLPNHLGSNEYYHVIHGNFHNREPSFWVTVIQPAVCVAGLRGTHEQLCLRP